VFHAALLSPYKENDVHSPNFINEPPDIIDREEEYEVEAIIGHHSSSSRRSYHVKWKGFPSLDNEWLTEKQLGNTSDILSFYK
jgi:Chromo (CHRromatin Organisation MOdifier) domain